MDSIAPSLRADSATLRSRFQSAQPFRHWVVDDFFTPDFAESLLVSFPHFERGNARNEQGELGGKSVVERVRELGPAYAALDDLVQSRAFLQWLSEATGIPGLRYDPHYFGGGTHENRHGQELDPHVDFNRHPADGSHRRLNLIVYLNREWDDAWGGSLELHSEPRSPDNRIQLITPLFNRCVVFETTEWSWHGFSKIDLPEARRDLSRRSIALYFYTDDRPAEELAPPHSTVYVDRPLPTHFRPGHELTEQDVAELNALLTRRDQHNQRLYRDLMHAETRIESLLAGRIPLPRAMLRALTGTWRYLRSNRGDGDRAALRAALVPLAARTPSRLRERLGRFFKRRLGIQTPTAPR